MAQSYAYIREQVVQGVIRASIANPIPLDRIRAQFDAAFFSINSQTAQAYAAQQDKRELLRTFSTITFVSGNGDLPTSTLKAYIEDGTFVPNGVVPAKSHYSFRRYPDWLRGGDTRLGLWTQVGDVIKAKTPAPVAAFSGTAACSFISSPEVPATESADFVAPDDFYPDFIAAMTQYILGQPMEVASQTA